MTTRMRRRLAALAGGLWLATAGSALAQEHRCAPDAVERAKKLLRFHLDDATLAERAGAGTKARTVAPIRALKGNATLDVLEVTSDVYKARYRMRFIYARGQGCALMGQEILEASSP